MGDYFDERLQALSRDERGMLDGGGENQYALWIGMLAFWDWLRQR